MALQQLSLEVTMRLKQQLMVDNRLPCIDEYMVAACTYQEVAATAIP